MSRIWLTSLTLLLLASLVVLFTGCALLSGDNAAIASAGGRLDGARTGDDRACSEDQRP